MTALSVYKGLLQPSLAVGMSRTITRSSRPAANLTHRLNPALPTRTLSRPFTQTSPLSKKPKNAKSNPAPAPSSSSAPAADSSSQPNPDDPHNFADVTAKWALLSQSFHADLQRSRSGGKYTPEVLGRLPVPVPDGASAAAAKTKGGPPPPPPPPQSRPTRTHPLRELASIVLRASGRQVSILASEVGYVKPIMAALQRSDDFSAQPQREEGNELELVLRVEVERPEEAERRIKGACNRWKERIREVTARREKVIKGWQKENVVTKDVCRKLEGELRALQTKELAAVEGVEKKELQGMQRKV